MDKLPKLFFLGVCVFLVAWSGIQDDAFTFSHGTRKITLGLENKARQLKWGHKTMLYFRLENIDPTRLSCSAPGLKFAGNPSADESSFEITPEKRFIKKDTLKVHIKYREENDSVWVHSFLIPIKN